MGEAQQRCDSREFAEWCAFERLDGPVGATGRLDHYLPELLAMFAQAHAARGRRYTADEFRPQQRVPGTVRQSPSEIYTRLRARYPRHPRHPRHARHACNRRSPSRDARK